MQLSLNLDSSKTLKEKEFEEFERGRLLLLIQNNSSERTGQLG
jgi:hypothetical protein